MPSERNAQHHRLVRSRSRRFRSKTRRRSHRRWPRAMLRRGRYRPSNWSCGRSRPKQGTPSRSIRLAYVSTLARRRPATRVHRMTGQARNCSVAAGVHRRAQGCGCAWSWPGGWYGRGPGAAWGCVSLRPLGCVTTRKRAGSSGQPLCYPPSKRILTPETLDLPVGSESLDREHTPAAPALTTTPYAPVQMLADPPSKRIRTPHP
jgi:hypothetical protein